MAHTQKELKLDDCRANHPPLAQQGLWPRLYSPPACHSATVGWVGFSLSTATRRQCNARSQHAPNILVVKQVHLGRSDDAICGLRGLALALALALALRVVFARVPAWHRPVIIHGRGVSTHSIACRRVWCLSRRMVAACSRYDIRSTSPGPATLSNQGGCAIPIPCGGSGAGLCFLRRTGAGPPPGCPGVSGSESDSDS
jgi:hypothetical protein